VLGELFSQGENKNICPIMDLVCCIIKIYKKNKYEKKIQAKMTRIVGYFINSLNLKGRKL